MRTATALKLERVLILTELLLNACVKRPGGRPLGTMKCCICDHEWIGPTEEHAPTCQYAALESELR